MIITYRTLVAVLCALVTTLICMLTAVALDTQSTRQFQRGYDVGYRQCVIDEEGDELAP